MLQVWHGYGRSFVCDLMCFSRTLGLAHVRWQKGQGYFPGRGNPLGRRPLGGVGVAAVGVPEVTSSGTTKSTLIAFRGVWGVPPLLGDSSTSRDWLDEGVPAIKKKLK